MSEELNVTDAEGGWRVVTADDVSAMMSELASLRAELEAAKQWGTDLSNELTHRTTKLAEARLWLDSSESALQEAQRALFRWLPNRIGSEYDDLIAADAMALMGLESTEGLREVGNEILVELMEKRRLLDDARAQKPVAWRPKFDIEGDWSLGEPPIESIEYWHEQGLEIEYAYLRSAPVPAQPAADENVAEDAYHRCCELIEPHVIREGRAGGTLPASLVGAVEMLIERHAKQPAAVPEAVAKGVSDSALLKAYTTETGKVLAHSWRPIFLDYARIGIKAALSPQPIPR